MSNKIINVAFASDNGYAEYLHVAIFSLLQNLKSDYFANIYILDGGISESNKRDIKHDVNKLGNGEIEFITMNRDNYSHLNSSYISQETYYRLDLPSLLPNIEKIIYIDCDVVIDGDLSTLYNIEMENNLTGAVSETTMVNYYQDIYHLNTSNGFFNAGVLLLNLKLRRKNPKKGEDILNFLNSNNTKLMACDQDGLNAVFHDTYIKLAPKYNALPALFAGSSASNLGYNKSEYIDAKKHPIVIHFAGEKPWKYFCSHPMKNKYVFYRKQIKSDNSDYIKNGFSIVGLVNHYMYSLQTWLMANLDTKQYRKYIYIPKKIITQRLSK